MPKVTMIPESISVDFLPIFGTGHRFYVARIQTTTTDNLYRVLGTDDENAFKSLMSGTVLKDKDLGNLSFDEIRILPGFDDVKVDLIEITNLTDNQIVKFS